MAESPLGEQEQPAASRLLGVLRNRNFLYLWLAQVFSQTAQQMINYVLVVQANALTSPGVSQPSGVGGAVMQAGSSTAISGIIISFTLPAILFSAIAGVYIDRQPKRRVLVLTNTGRALMMLGYIFFTGHEFPLGALLVLYLVTLVFASISQFFVPAEGAAIPLLVQRDELIAANSLFNLTFTASQLIGFIILGPLFLKLLVHDDNFGPFYIVLFVLFLACSGLTWLLPRDEQVKPIGNGDGSVRARVGTAIEELREGWAYIRADQGIYGAIIQWSVAIAVMMSMAVIGPRFLALELGLQPSDLYIILFPGGIGLLIGVVLVGRYAREHNRLRMLNYSMLVAGIGLLLFALAGGALREAATLLAPGADVRSATAPWLTGFIVVLVFLLGLLNSFVSVPAQTTLQERARPDIRARVFSAFYTTSNIILLGPLIIVGPLADLAGVVQTVFLIGLGVIAVALWGIRRGLDMPPLPFVPGRQPLVAPIAPDPGQSASAVTAHQRLNGNDATARVEEPAGRTK